MGVVKILARNPETKRKRLQPVEAVVESAHFALTRPLSEDIWAGPYIVTHKRTGCAVMYGVRTQKHGRTLLSALEATGVDWDFRTPPRKESEQHAVLKAVVNSVAESVEASS